MIKTRLDLGTRCDGQLIPVLPKPCLQKGVFPKVGASMVSLTDDCHFCLSWKGSRDLEGEGAWCEMRPMGK